MIPLPVKAKILGIRSFMSSKITKKIRTCKKLHEII